MLIFSLLLSMHFGVLAETAAAGSDPNDVNQCGQYNAYMENLCQYDRYEGVKYVMESKPLCADCYGWQGNLFDRTKAPAADSDHSSSGANQEGSR
ncbi:MAG: hypothetical protein NZ480_07595 [Bdellovibrionaceae bacterium]|nr:hypothetical protein [Pseudobdellovibrionaceae bacterium]MDW8189986.1 hypothetical protein [Pseudobdellovibrionaceae bacterium]